MSLETFTEEFQCVECLRWKTDEDIAQYTPCVCKVCYQEAEELYWDLTT